MINTVLLIEQQLGSLIDSLAYGGDVQLLEAGIYGHKKEPSKPGFTGDYVDEAGVHRYYRDGERISNPNPEAVKIVQKLTKTSGVSKDVLPKDADLEKIKREVKREKEEEGYTPEVPLIDRQKMISLEKDLDVMFPAGATDREKIEILKKAADKRNSDAWKESHLPPEYHKAMKQSEQWSKDETMVRLLQFKVDENAKMKGIPTPEELEKIKKLKEKANDIINGNGDPKDPDREEAISLWDKLRKEAEDKASEKEKAAADKKATVISGATPQKPVLDYSTGHWVIHLHNQVKVSKDHRGVWSMKYPDQRMPRKFGANTPEGMHWEEVLKSLRTGGWQKDAFNMEESRKNIILSSHIARDYNYRIQRQGGVKPQTAKATSNILSSVDMLLSGTLRRMGVSTGRVPWASILYALGSNYKEPRKMVETAADMVADNSDAILKFADEEQRKGEIVYIRKQQEKEEIKADEDKQRAENNGVLLRPGKPLTPLERLAGNGFYAGIPSLSAQGLRDGMQHAATDEYMQRQQRRLRQAERRREDALQNIAKASRGQRDTTLTEPYTFSHNEAINWEDYSLLSGFVSLMEDTAIQEAGGFTGYPILTPYSFWGDIITKRAPHTRIIGPTSSGKSVLAQAVAHDLQDKLLIIDPVWRPGNWGGLAAVTVTEDGQYTEIDKALSWILDEMKRRGAALQKGDTNFPRLTIIWDEVPDTVSELSNAGEVIRRVAQRGRHSNIHMIGIGQSERVGSWGLEGFGDASENFCSVYLGSKAVTQVPELAGAAHVGVIEWQGKKYPINLNSIMELSKKPLAANKAIHIPDVQMVGNKEAQETVEVLDKRFAMALRTHNGEVHFDPLAKHHAEVMINKRVNPDHIKDTGFVDTNSGEYHSGNPEIGPNGDITSITKYLPIPSWIDKKDIQKSGEGITPYERALVGKARQQSNEAVNWTEALEDTAETPIEFDEKEELIKKLLENVAKHHDDPFFGLLVVQCYVVTRNLSSAIDAAKHIWGANAALRGQNAEGPSGESNEQEGTTEALSSYIEDLESMIESDAGSSKAHRPLGINDKAVVVPVGHGDTIKGDIKNPEILDRYGYWHEGIGEGGKGGEGAERDFAKKQGYPDAVNHGSYDDQIQLGWYAAYVIFQGGAADTHNLKKLEAATIRELLFEALIRGVDTFQYQALTEEEANRALDVVQSDGFDLSQPKEKLESILKEAESKVWNATKKHPDGSSYSPLGMFTWEACQKRRANVLRLAERGGVFFMGSDHLPAIKDMLPSDNTTDSYQEDLGEDQTHKEGDPWQGKSGRWFVMKNGRPVPHKNPKGENKAPPKKPDKVEEPTHKNSAAPPIVAPTAKEPQVIKRKDAEGDTELRAQAALEKFEARKEGTNSSNAPPKIPEALKKEGVRVYIVNSRFSGVPFLPRFGPLHHRGVFFCPAGQSISKDGVTSPKCMGYGTQPGMDVFRPEGARTEITYREIDLPAKEVADRIENWNSRWTLLHNCQTAAKAVTAMEAVASLQEGILEEENPALPKTVAMDLDGTLAQYNGWKGEEVIGDLLPGAREAMQSLKDAGTQVIIFTTRGRTDLIKAWLEKNRVPYDHINQNPDQPKGTSGKILADVYVDDRALHFQGDWAKTLNELKHRLQETQESTEFQLSLMTDLMEGKVTLIDEGEREEGDVWWSDDLAKWFTLEEEALIEL